MFDPMMTVKTTSTTEANQRKVNQLQATMQEMLLEALHRGFFGTVTFELGIQDGTIQHVRSAMERIER
jgi:hypothetical protein